MQTITFNLMKARILVTGGTGYIGSHTTVELLQNGYDVVIIDNLSNSSLDVLDGIEHITGKRPDFEQFDLTDYNKVLDFFQRNNDIAAIIHFAAHKAVGESVQKPLKYYRNNLTSLKNLLETLHDQICNCLVFSSSCTVYGQPDILPVTESAPIKPAESPYGNTKRICEEIISDTINSESSTLNSIALRYFNPIGAHPSGHIGETPQGTPANLLPFLTQTARGLRDELQVFGGDYDTHDGSCLRDYIDIMDLARAHVVAIDRLLKNKNKEPFEVFNIGTGKGVSVLEMIKAFEAATGKNINYRITDRRPGDIEQIYADPSRAHTELGWKATTPLEETLRNAWNWEQRREQD